MPTASAPGKLMLYGDHAVVHGRPCIVTAVDQRIKATVERRPDNLIILSAPQLNFSYQTNIGQVKGPHPKEARFALVAISNLFDKVGTKTGLDIKTDSQFSEKFGFGSSSASAVAVLQAAAEALNVQLTQQQLFDLGYKTVIDIQGVGSGFDIAAAIWGGTIQYTKGKVAEVVKLRTERLPLVVGWTGVKADTATLVKMVAERMKAEPDRINAIFDAKGKAVMSARRALENSDWKTAGELMNTCQDMLENLGVSSNELRALIGAAKCADAWGAKLSGAGGGDCMIALAPDERKVAKAIEQAKGTPIPARVGADGVRLE